MKMIIKFPESAADNNKTEHNRAKQALKSHLKTAESCFQVQ